MRRLTKALVALTIAVSTVGAFGVSAGATTIDGLFDRTGPVGPGATFNLTVAGRGGVPATGVGAVALNVTATNPTANSYFTVWPTGQPQPNASNLNFGAGQTIPNMVIVPLGARRTDLHLQRRPAASTSSSTSSAGSPPANTYTGLTPARLLDTTPRHRHHRRQLRRSTGPIRPSKLDQPAPSSDRGGVPATGVGCGRPQRHRHQPDRRTATSPSGRPGNPNPTHRTSTSAPARPSRTWSSSPSAPDGQISIYNDTGNVDVIVDVLGWFPTGTTYTGLTPARLLDTRPGTATIDGNFRSTGPIPGSKLDQPAPSPVVVVFPPPVSERSPSTSPPPTRPPTATSPSGRPGNPNPTPRTSTSSPAKPSPTWSSSPSAPTDRSPSTTTPATPTSSSTSSAGSPPAPPSPASPQPDSSTHAFRPRRLRRHRPPS